MGSEFVRGIRQSDNFRELRHRYELFQRRSVGVGFEPLIVPFIRDGEVHVRLVLLTNVSVLFLSDHFFEGRGYGLVLNDSMMLFIRYFPHELYDHVESMHRSDLGVGGLVLFSFPLLFL